MDVTRELKATQRRKQRRVRPWWRHERGRGTPPLLGDQAFDVRHEGGGVCPERRFTRPEHSYQSTGGGPVEDPRSQERVQRHTVDQIVETFVPVQVLDDPVPQMVDQLVEVFKLLDIAVPEQVVDVPKISQDRYPAAHCAVGGSANRPFFSSSRPLTFQFLVVEHIFVEFFMVSSQDKGLLRSVKQQFLFVDVLRLSSSTECGPCCYAAETYSQCKLQQTAGILQVQFLGEVVDAPVVVQRLVPWSQWLGCGRP